MKWSDVQIFLKQSPDAVEPHKGKLDLSAILNNPYAGNGQKVTFDPKAVYNFELEKTLDEKVLLKKCAKAISKGEHVELSVDVTNTDRTFGTILGAEITRQIRNRAAGRYSSNQLPWSRWTEFRCIYSERSYIESDR